MNTVINQQKLDQIICFTKEVQNKKKYELAYCRCYTYFKEHRYNILDNILYSCLQLESYLVHFSMYRGSSPLMTCDVLEMYEPLMKYFDSISKNKIWNIDVDNYNDSSIQNEIINTFNDIRLILGNTISTIIGKKFIPSTILITKIMQGVFGCVPAFDSYFVNVISNLYGKNVKKYFQKLSRESIDILYDFYSKNVNVLTQASKQIYYDDNSNLNYKIIKIIDLYMFSIGKYKY